MAAFTKQPSEVKVWAVDFTNRLNGATISSLTSVVSNSADLTITGEAISTTTSVKFTASGGTDGVTYTVTFIIVTSEGETTEGEVLVYVVETPISTGAPVKPPEWILEEGHRYLKGIVINLSPIGDEVRGLTQDDFNSAENYAWRVLTSRLVAPYDISGWTAAPPTPLFEIWDLLASSYIAALVGQRKNIDDSAGSATHKEWMSLANEMMRNLINPRVEADRMNLIKTDGTIQHKRSRSNIPKVVNIAGVEFFPSDKTSTTAWGDSKRGSVEEFIDEHCQFI